MNWTIYGMECVGALILFTCLIMIPLCKNPVWWIHDYPKNIQEKYFETHECIPTEALSAPVLLKKGFAVLLALSILTSCSALGDRHGTWSRSLLAVRPDCGGVGIEKEQGFLFVG